MQPDEYNPPRLQKPTPEEFRETAAGDVLRKPLREHYDNDQDFDEAQAIWEAAWAEFGECT